MKEPSQSKKGIIGVRTFLLWGFLGYVLIFMPEGTFAQQQKNIAAIDRPCSTFASVAEEASLAVVGIKAEIPSAGVSNVMKQWPFSKPFGPSGEDLFDSPSRRRSPNDPIDRYGRLPITNGSGFIISGKGYILASNYVVAGADKVSVVLSDGRFFAAEIVGTDPDSDVAVIKINGQNLPVLDLSDSDNVEVGQWVLAIGNPLGLDRTVTSGIISAKDRSGIHLARYEDFIQTDAAINFGNTGGPLVDLHGKAVGMIIAGLGYGGNAGIGFAVPSNMAKWVADQLIETGEVVRGFLGAQVQNMTAGMAEAFGLDTVTGVLVPEVSSGSPADKAGLKPDDVILEVNGQPAGSAGQLRNCIAMTKPDTKVEILVFRNGQRETLTATLAKRSEPERVLGRPRRERAMPLGLSVRSLTGRLAQHYGYEGQSGVVVDNVMTLSIAAQEGIVPGMLIKEVDKEPVLSAKEFTLAMRKAMRKGYALLLVTNGRITRFVLLDFGKEYDQTNT